MLDPVTRIAAWGEMHDDRMIRRPALRGIDTRDGIRAFGVAAKAIDGLGRKRDELSRIEQRRGVRDVCLADGKHALIRRFRLIRHRDCDLSS